jgi:3-methyladenine DNA glycosylase AlkD
VSFVVRAKHGDNPPNYPGFLDKMFELCQECLQYDERFNQLGVGWLLREMYLANATGVNKFIRNNYDSFTR